MSKKTNHRLVKRKKLSHLGLENKKKKKRIGKKRKKRQLP